MFRPSRPRRLLTAAASALAAAGVLANPAYATGSQTFDASLDYTCAYPYNDIAAPTIPAVLRLQGTVPATTTDGEAVSITNPTATLRLLPAGASSSETLKGLLTSLTIGASGTGANESPINQDFRYFVGGKPIASTPFSSGGFGPFALPIFTAGDAPPSPLRTQGLEPVVLTGKWIDFWSLTFSGGNAPPPANGLPRTCTPVDPNTAIVSIPNVTTSPAPSVTTVSPSTGPLRGGNTLTITGSGFSAGSPTVRFGGQLATGVTVIDDRTLTVKAPLSYIETSERIVVEVAGRTSLSTPASSYGYVGALTVSTITSVTPTFGAAGDVITVRGNDLDILEGFFFGGIEGSITTVSESELRVTVPAAASGAPGPEAFMAAFGPHGSAEFAPGATDRFTYVAPTPIPSLSFVTPPWTRAGSGGLHILVGKNLNTVQFVKVGTKRVAPLATVGSNYVVFQSPAQPVGTYRITMLTRDGRTLSTASTIQYR